MRNLNRYIFGVLLIAFIGNTFYIYFTPVDTDVERLSLEATEGKMLYQKHNCQSCHQLYGLGGYLGPDLTNVMRAPGKGELWVRAMVKNGGRQMPQYTFSENELRQLVAFFREMDQRGNGLPLSFEVAPSGMIEMQD